MAHTDIGLRAQHQRLLGQTQRFVVDKRLLPAPVDTNARADRRFIEGIT